MPTESSETNDASPARPARFEPTSWTAVLAAQQSGLPETQAALSQLCQTYWSPLFHYVRRLGHGEEEARDLTQQFFFVLLSKNYLGAADRRRGKFRTFLLTALSHFLANEWDRTRARKRGGGAVPVSLDDDQTGDGPAILPATELTPLKAFEQTWASTVLRQAMGRLEDEQRAAGKTAQFDQLKEFLEDKTSPGGYEEVAARLQMSVGAVRVAVLRLRQRLAELVRAEVARTMAQPTEAEIEAEVRHLFVAFN